jgi:hypothetical protein
VAAAGVQVMDQTELLATCATMFAESAALDDVLAFLREQGCSKVESIRTLVQVGKLNLRDSKRVVHASKVWADTREDDERLHDTLLSGINSDGKHE